MLLAVVPQALVLLAMTLLFACIAQKLAPGRGKLAPTGRHSRHVFATLKYTNTAYDKVSDIPNMCYIFEKPRAKGRQKGYSGMSNTEIQIHIYTNTAYDKVP